jgi:hypothetical protein
MNQKQKIVIVTAAVVLIAATGYFAYGRSKLRQAQVKPIDVAPRQDEISNGPANEGNVSPISGVACENWNKRPIAAMQPSDVPARPAAGFSDADMVFEMPVFTGSVTRLMGVYVCHLPEDIGSLRSARHDYIPLASGLDAVLIAWGYSKFAGTLLTEKNVLDYVDQLTMPKYFSRWVGADRTVRMRLEDTGHITSENVFKAMGELGYRTEGTFSGYPHQAEAKAEDRPSGGHLRVAFPNPYDVAYDYDPKTNSYLRSWDGEPDTDKNNGKRVAPKNIVVMTAASEQIRLSIDYAARGVQNPWDLVPEEDRAGLNNTGMPGGEGYGRYNNMEIGDPWFDTQDSGSATFYFNGQEYKGSWKKDKSKMESKLTFFGEDGKEIRFAPGQIWVEIMEPGQGLEWQTVL